MDQGGGRRIDIAMVKLLNIWPKTEQGVVHNKALTPVMMNKGCCSIGKTFT